MSFKDVDNQIKFSLNPDGQMLYCKMYVNSLILNIMDRYLNVKTKNTKQNKFIKFW